MRVSSAQVEWVGNAPKGWRDLTTDPTSFDPSITIGSWTGPGPALLCFPLSSSKIPSTRISSAGIFGSHPAQPLVSLSRCSYPGRLAIRLIRTMAHPRLASRSEEDTYIKSPHTANVRRLLPSIPGEKVGGGIPWPCLCNLTASKSPLHNDQRVI